MTINTSHIEFQKETNILTYLHIEEKKYGMGPWITCWNVPLIYNKDNPCLYSLVDGKYFGREHRVFLWNPTLAVDQLILFKTFNVDYVEHITNYEFAIFQTQQRTNTFTNKIECLIKDIVSKHQLRLYL